jgi:4-hydroxybenzoate polyprenyltransferase
MKWLTTILRLTRLPNLVIVLLSQTIPYWLVLRPALLKAGTVPSLDEQLFGFIAAATILTTFAGYVINDYCDRHIDAINKPNSVVYGKHIPAGVALVFYGGLLLVVHWLAFIIDKQVPTINRWPLWLFPAVSFALLLYAWQLKCTPVLGNLLVSILCGLVPVMLIFAEERPIWLASFRMPETTQKALGTVWLYGLFAFITNLLREQVKDLEDIKGDAACGCNTLAVTKGARFAKKPAGFTALTLTTLIVFLLYFWYQVEAPVWKLATGVLLLFAPAVFSTIHLYRAQSKNDFSKASLWVKLIMVAGLFLLI